MDCSEKKERRLCGYNGILVDVTLDEVSLCDGSRTLREVVHHPGGVTVLALDEKGRVPCVRQFRYPFGRVLLELPAGKLEPGEDPLLCAKRELSEETGLEAERWTDLGSILSSPGYSTEQLHLYLARRLRQGRAHPDEGEFLECEFLPLSRLLEEVMSGRIQDGKTVAAVLKGVRYLDREAMEES